MTNELILRDRDNHWIYTGFDISDLSNIEYIYIDVWRGDEDCTIAFYNGDKSYFFSSEDRENNIFNDVFEYDYDLYNAVTGVNLIDAFNRRKDSYWRRAA